MKYLLTVADRFTRWPEAFPLPNIEATTCVRALISEWISRYGSPQDLTHIPHGLSSGRVYVRIDAVKPPLHPRYSGPFEVLKREDKYFELLVKGKSKNVSIDWLKPP